jgi:hypothetical protein
MKQYLLSVCYQAGSTQPPPEALSRIMSDVMAVQKEMQTAGVWVFSGGLHPSSSSTPSSIPHQCHERALRVSNWESHVRGVPIIEINTVTSVRIAGSPSGGAPIHHVNS